MIWTGTKQELLTFLENLNSKHKTVKFEHNIPHSRISFLDTSIYTDKNTTENPLISNPSSMHIQTIQSHLWEAYLISQALRIKTICSTLTGYQKHCAILKQNFIERGYEENILNDEIDEGDNIDRKDLLSKKQKNIKDRISCLKLTIENFQWSVKLLTKLLLLECSSNKSGFGKIVIRSKWKSV